MSNRTILAIIFAVVAIFVGIAHAQSASNANAFSASGGVATQDPYGFTRNQEPYQFQRSDTIDYNRLNKDDRLAKPLYNDSTTSSVPYSSPMLSQPMGSSLSSQPLASPTPSLAGPR